jgi:hypothetical protein
MFFLQTFFFFFYQKDLDNDQKKWIIARFQVLCTLNKTSSSYTECLCNTSSFSRSLLVAFGTKVSKGHGFGGNLSTKLTHKRKAYSSPSFFDYLFSKRTGVSTI